MSDNKRPLDWPPADQPLAARVFPERSDAGETALDAWVTGFWLSRCKPSIWRGRECRRFVSSLLIHAEVAKALDQAALCKATREAARSAFVSRKEPAGAQALALVREAAHRSLGLLAHPPQVFAAWKLTCGRLIELDTGEGKTLAAGLASCLAALAGVPTHIVTVNDYLAERDAQMLGPLFAYLNLTVGVVHSGVSQSRRAAEYAKNLTYCTNKDLVFDYLRDRVNVSGVNSLAQLSVRQLNGPANKHDPLRLRGLHFAIIDEADSILIDEAGTPLILSTARDKGHNQAAYQQVLQSAATLEIDKHYKLDVPKQVIELTAEGRQRVEQFAMRYVPHLVGTKSHIDTANHSVVNERESAEVASGTGETVANGLYAPPHADPNTSFDRNSYEQAVKVSSDPELEFWGIAWIRNHYVLLALRALYLLRRDHHYVVHNGKVVIVDEFTGRMLFDRSWEQGLHQLVETKEGCSLTGVTTTLARLTYQTFFARYLRLSGMSGTLREVARETASVYSVRTERVEPNTASRRVEHSSRLLPDRAAHHRAIVQEVLTMLANGQSVLVGTRSVQSSVEISNALQAAAVAHQVLNALQTADEAMMIAKAGLPSAVTVATNMAGRGTDIPVDTTVIERGGLHVLLTEWHESARIDRQLFGRCARQGNPGSCRAIVCLEDDVIQRHGGVLTRWMTRYWGRESSGGEPPPWATGLLRRVVQGRAEQVNASLRRITLLNDIHSRTQLAFSGAPE